MESSTTVGIIANPASARDIRRLVADGGATTTHDKLNLLKRLLAGLGSVGVERVLSMADRSGITAGLMRAAERPSASAWPRLSFVDQVVTGTADDTRVAARVMVEAGVGAIVVLGGDGTNRIVAAESGPTPLVPISTGTNNAFPRSTEPTVAGIAAGLIATSPRLREPGTFQATVLMVECGGRTERALVDVAIGGDDGIGTGAVWDATSIRELFLSVAEPDAIGLSAIGGHLHPVSVRDPHGLAIGLGEPANRIIHPPIGPGLVQPVGVTSLARLTPNRPVEARTRRGVITVDGERLFRFGPSERVRITLRSDGPVVVDVAATLRIAATEGDLSTLVDPAPAPTGVGVSETTTRHHEKGSDREPTQSARALHRDGSHPAVRDAHLAGVSR